MTKKWARKYYQRLRKAGYYEFAGEVAQLKKKIMTTTGQIDMLIMKRTSLEKKLGEIITLYQKRFKCPICHKKIRGSTRASLHAKEKKHWGDYNIYKEEAIAAAKRREP